MEKKMGRPTMPEHRKKTLRLSRVEDRFKNIMDKLESKKDKELVLQVLEELRA